MAEESSIIIPNMQNSNQCVTGTFAPLLIRMHPFAQGLIANQYVSHMDPNYTFHPSCDNVAVSDF